MDDFELTSNADEGHHRDDEEVEIPRSSLHACARSAVVVAERPRWEPLEWGWPPGAGPARPRTVTMPSWPSRLRESSSRRSMALGHGGAAADAGPLRRGEVVRERPIRDLVLLTELCHDALRDTRGAAIGMAFVSPPEATLTWLGVGNVEGRVLSGDPPPRGRRAPSPLEAGCSATSCRA